MTVPVIRVLPCKHNAEVKTQEAHLDMFKEKRIVPTGIGSYSQLSLPFMVDINTRAVTNPLVIILFCCRVSFVEFVYRDVVTITQRRECVEGLHVGLRVSL